MPSLLAYRRNGISGTPLPKPNYQIQSNYRSTSAQHTVKSKVPTVVFNKPSDTTDTSLNAFKARPLKLYRKAYSANGGKVSVDQVNLPGGYIYDSNCSSDCSGNILISEDATQYDMTHCAYRGNPNNKCTYEAVALNKTRALTATGQGSIDISYSYNSSQYLRRKCMTYDQNITHINVPKNNYLNGTPVYDVSMTNCYNNKCKITTFNPSNRSFQVQGAVSSGGRIAKLKYDTVRKAAKGLDKAIWGAAAVNASTYSGRPEAPYINKSVYQDTSGCCCYARPAQCFKFRLF